MEELINLKLGILNKKVGYNLLCKFYHSYSENRKIDIAENGLYSHHVKNKDIDKDVCLPRKLDVLNWLLDEKGIVLIIHPIDSLKSWTYTILHDTPTALTQILKPNTIDYLDRFKALDAALEKALESLIETNDWKKIIKLKKRIT